MATISNTPRPGYVWDSTDNVWYPIGVGGHGHPDYITQATAISPTTVDAKGDLLVGSAADTISRLAVGANGEQIVADSSTSSGLRWQGSYAAGVNFVMNGNMNISQRGTSFAAVVNDYTMDRWNARNNLVGVFTVSQDTDAPAGFKTSAKFLCTTADASLAANDFLFYRQQFEGQALQALQKGTATAKTTTLSFWVKANLTGNYVARLSDGTNTRSIASLYTINAANTWEKKTISFAGDTSGLLNNDNASSISLEFWLGAGSDRTSGTLNTTWAASVNANTAVGQTNLAATLNNFWSITGVQWEIGSVASEFNLLAGNGNIQGELAACQRYFFALASGNNRYISNANYWQSTTIHGVFHLPVSMRTAPTIVQTTGTNYYSMASGGTTDTFNSLTLQAGAGGQDTYQTMRWYNNTEVSGTVGYGGTVHVDNASSSVAFSAEL